MTTDTGSSSERHQNETSQDTFVSKTLLSLWLQRFRTRRQLGRLEPHMLHVLGISQKEARAQASKPFWMA